MQIRRYNGVHDLLALALDGGPATFFRALRYRPLDIFNFRIRSIVFSAYGGRPLPCLG